MAVVTVSVPGDTPDRPAAELLAEWKSLVLPYAAAGKVPPLWQRFVVARLDDVLERLARAEQAFAAIEALHHPEEPENNCAVCWGPVPCDTLELIRCDTETRLRIFAESDARATIRASQGGQA